ncbi:MAG: energy-coupling factor ABC transporter ATP-binding protein [Candidatus Bathyarchaeia archaeon]
MIEVEGLTFKYPNDVLALDGVNLNIREGEFLALMGENGAGKTTLIKHFNGLLKPTAGVVRVDGVDTRHVSVASLSRKVGLVFQNPDHQFFCETVREEISFGLVNFGYPRPLIERRVNQVLRMLDLEEYGESSPFALSGGEKKRVALASVLAWNPKYLILDEPTIGQDALQKERLKNFIIQLVTQGRCVVIVTHDVEFVAECKPRVAVLSKGRIIAEGPAQRILSSEEIVEKGSLIMPQIAELMELLKGYGFPAEIIDVYTACEKIGEKLRDV